MSDIRLIAFEGTGARDLGDQRVVFANWMNCDAIDSGRKPGITSDEHKDLVDLRRRLRVLSGGRHSGAPVIGSSLVR